MLVVKRRGNCSRFALQRCENGMRTVKSELLEHHPNSAAIIWRIYVTYLVSLRMLHKRTITVTLEYPRQSKQTILTDKSLTSNPNTLITGLSRMLALELIGTEKAYRPFWNAACEDKSTRLWLPTEIDSRDSALNCSNLSLDLTRHASWYSTTMITAAANRISPTTFSVSCMSTHVDKWEKSAIQCLKFPIYPTAKQRKVLLQWMGTYRVVYNRAVADIEENKAAINFYELRNKHVTQKGNEVANDWEFETPKDIRAGAVKQLASNYKAAFTNLKKANIKHFKMGFKRKQQTQSICIPKTALKLTKGKLQVYPRYIKDKINCHWSQSKKILDNGGINHDVNLVYDNRNFYLHVPMDCKISHPGPKEDICAVDPGVRNFATIYSNTKYVKVTPNKEILRKLHVKLDKLRSLRARKLISKKQYKAMHYTTMRRLNCLIDELHFKTCNLLLNNYETVILPPYESQVMVGRKGLSSNTKRNMLSLRPYQFRTRLKQKLTGHVLYETTEEFTSKTCTRCGNVKLDLGINDTYNCDKCKLVIDRDVNGARNIMLKHLCPRVVPSG